MHEGRKTQEELRCRKENAGMKDAGRKTQEDFFTNIFTSHFIARVRKGCWRVACERMLETEHKLHILTPLLWPSRRVLFSWCWGPLHRGFQRAPSVWCGLPYHISSLTLWESASNSFGGFPSAPSVGCGLPYHLSSLTLWESAGNCIAVSEGPLGRVWPSLPHLVSNPLGVSWQLLWDPNSTELNNNSTPTRSPTGSLKSNV